MAEPTNDHRPRIVLADDEVNFRDSLAEVLREEGMVVTTTGDGTDALRILGSGDYDLLISDIKMPGMDGLSLLRTLHQTQPGLGVILVTAFGSVDSAIEAMKLGATDYVLKPLLFDDLILKIHRVLKVRDLTRENRRLRAEIERRVGEDVIVGNAPAVRDMMSLVDKVARTRTNVLILGESGTGKELIARAIHTRGVTTKAPFVPVNCGGIPDTLFESEMFGHRRGAFTGAIRDKIGFFEAANGGTLFMDEVGNLSLGAQMSLLRAIELKTITRVGDTKSMRFDVRVISATNRDLAGLVAEGQYRDDLYFRLNVVQIQLPPLRDRSEDIPALIEHFIRKYNAVMKRACSGVSDAAMQCLRAHNWKGNIRELENVVERALIFAEDRDIEDCDLPFGPGAGQGALPRPNAVNPARPGARPGAAAEPVPDNLEEAIKAFERVHLGNILGRTGYDKTAAAAALGVSMPTLYRKIHDLKLPLKEPK